MNKLLFVSHSPNLQGGAEFSLLETIIEASRRGYDCHVVLPDEGPLYLRLCQLEVKCYVTRYITSVRPADASNKTHEDPAIAILHADALVDAYNLIRKINPTVVITNTITVPWYNYAARALGVPNIMMIRELFDSRNNMDMLPSTEVYFRLVGQCLDLALYNSKFTQQSYRDHLPDVPSDIYYPVVRIPDRRHLGKTTSLKKRSVRIITPGSIILHKNQLEVVKAIDILVAQGYNHIHLTLLGRVDGNEYPKQIRDYILSRQLRDYVTFEPFTDNPFDVILNHDIVVIPSKSEAFGRVTLEGLLLGRLVVGRNSGATPELVTNLKTGLLYEGRGAKDLAEQLRWTLDNRSRAAHIASTGQKITQQAFLSDEVFLPFFNAIDHLAQKDKSETEQPNLYYHPVVALIMRNIHMNERLGEYATSLNEAAKKIEKLERSKPKNLFRRLPLRKP